MVTALKNVMVRVCGLEVEQLFGLVPEPAGLVGMLPTTGDGAMAVATEEIYWVAIAGYVQQGVDGRFGSLFGTFAKGAEDDVGDGVEPAAEAEDAAVDDAGVGDMHCDSIAVAAVQLFGKVLVADNQVFLMISSRIHRSEILCKYNNFISFQHFFLQKSY